MTYIETTHKKIYIVYLKITKNNHPSVRLRYFRLLSNKLKKQVSSTCFTFGNLEPRKHNPLPSLLRDVRVRVRA